MLTRADIELIKATRLEVIQNRTKIVTLIREVAGEEDPFTGNTKVVEIPSEIEVVWQTQTGKDVINYVNGVEVATGDVLADTPIETEVNGAKYIVRNDIKYVVKAVDNIGLGEDNRYVFLLRRVV